LIDAEATRIYAQAYSVDADFYQFLKTLETYRSSLDGETVLLLSTDGEFFKFLKGSQK
jgi:membrane protease subunit HflC